MKLFFSLLIGCFMLSACSKPVNLQFDGTHYYYITNGTQVAFDGKDWFQLRRWEQPVGEFIEIQEEWIKLTGENAGSRVSTWRRSLSTFNNTNLPPVFIRN